MTKFKAHLKKRGLNINSYSKLLGASASFLYEIDGGSKLPGYELAYRIDNETGGEIPMKYWGDNQTKKEGQNGKTNN